MSGPNLFRAFRVDEVDHVELELVLSQFCHGARQSGPHQVLYGGSGSHDYALSLLYTKDDTIKAIEPGPILTTQLIALIACEVEAKLIAVTEHKIVREVLFAAVPLKGAYRFEQRFQILPLPEVAPKANLSSAKQPFELEVKAPASTDPLVNNIRSHRMCREIELLLSGLGDSSIHSLRPGLNERWVLIPDPHRVALLQEYYEVPPRELDGTTFAAADESISLVSPEELFGPLSRVFGQPLRFPNNITASLSTYYGLGKSERETVLRICYWIQFARTILHQSRSAAYMAIVTAVEAFFEDAPETTCAHCEQRLPGGKGKRAQFAEFLDQHVPLGGLTIDFVGQLRFKDRLKYLYDKRSSITHGDLLLGADAEQMMAFRPVENQEDHDLWTLLRIMPYALAKWLLVVSQPKSS